MDYIDYIAFQPIAVTYLMIMPLNLKEPEKPSQSHMQLMIIKKIIIIICTHVSEMTLFFSFFSGLFGIGMRIFYI